MGRDSYTLYFEPQHNDTQVDAPLTAHVRHMDGRLDFKLCPEEKLLHMVLADVASLEDLKTMSEELRGVALESAFERVLDRIEQLSGARSTIVRMSDNHRRDKTPSRLRVFFKLIRKKDAMRARGYISTNEAGLEWIAGRMGRLNAKTWNRFNHLSVIGSIEIAKAELTCAEINGLATNDIVLAEVTGAWDDRHVIIRFSHCLALEGNMVEKDRILIQDVIKSNGEKNKMMNKKDFAARPADMPVEDIPVELVFEIGRTDIAIGELSHLQPGYTIQLDEAIDRHKPVTIRGNGVAVGKGEIVLIDDRLGIRILEFNKEM
jgi:type III secretion system YscQ/HrcQ family protein